MKKVFFMAEGFGMYTKGIKDKKEATELMRKEAQKEFDIDPKYFGDYFNFKPDEITEDSVVESNYFQHRNKDCEGETIGNDNICYHCGEPINGSGRKCFAFFSKD